MTIILYILFAHLISDFLLQPDWLFHWKERSGHGVLFHAFVHLVVLMIVLFPYSGSPAVAVGMAVIIIAHAVIDQWKLNVTTAKHFFHYFVLDQCLHLAIIVSATLLFIPKTPARLPFPGLEGFYDNPYVPAVGSLLIILTAAFHIARLQVDKDKK